MLPDFSSIVDRAEDVECVILTHGHEDHVGSLAYFLREVNVPVYGTALAVELARSRIEELGLTPDLRAIEPLEWVEAGPIRFTMVRVTHSVPHATGIVFDTPEGKIVHSGDFKLDPTPIDGVPTDLGTFAGFGRQGVRLLLSDSTNAEVPGFVPSEASVGGPLAEFVSHAEAASSWPVSPATFTAFSKLSTPWWDPAASWPSWVARCCATRSLPSNWESCRFRPSPWCRWTSCWSCPQTRRPSSAPGVRVSHSPRCR